LWNVGCKEITLNVARGYFLDVDGTLHYGDYIWERMHKLCGTWDNLGEKYLRMYRNKEIDYAEFARLDVAAWRGASEELFNHAIESMTLHSELDEFFETCKVNNISVYLISNGVAQLAKYIVDNYNLAGYFANEVIVKDKKLTGEISLDYGFEGKGDVVRSVLNIIGISKEQCCCCGRTV